ncbi:MAG: D-alanyl-D-alanine carboxypeptidase/D-alanyl-D-alanine-endopeptidase [Steroidobacteraceae bacterium]|jgi:D-alanyl-D-alanine carboxypeptidase/D-alanyl-D-alanine-endopeptidase (penicillin-binding protein 4)|nr:D-alanyl-D-alanine carboxypeptidase/D-alanyl-D-alanine-endopeptidase [Steroidobacteraceae bacterium]
MQHTPKPFAAIIAALLASLALGTSAQAASLDLPQRPRAALKQQLVPESDVSVVVRDIATGESLVEVNPGTPRVPASTMKILPTFAALDILGPAYTWKTTALVDGPVSKGVLKGNLYLQGGGDPLMTIERWWRFVSDLRQTGIKTITGDIYIDATVFAPLGESPEDFDGKGWRTYNALPNGLLVNLNSSEFIIRPSVEGYGVDIEVDPMPANLQVDNRVRRVEGACRGRAGDVSIRNDPLNSSRVVVTGKMSSRCPAQVTRRVIMEPADYAYGTFVTLWRQQGGEIKGGLQKGPTPATARPILKQDSLTLGEIIRVTNKFSSNAMARTLVLTLGAEKARKPATTADGELVINDWLKGRGLEFPELVIGNGSGLSREARISADSMSRLLIAAARSRFAPEFEASLSLGGIDGTLRKRFAGVPDASRIRMKTGTLADASSLAGYVTGESGRTYAVVIFVNHREAQNGPGEAIQAAVVRWVMGQ